MSWLIFLEDRVSILKDSMVWLVRFVRLGTLDSGDLQENQWKQTLHGICESVDLPSNGCCRLRRGLGGIGNCAGDADEAEACDTDFSCAHKVPEDESSG